MTNIEAYHDKSAEHAATVNGVEDIHPLIHVGLAG
jgi:hypothetical protein